MINKLKLQSFINKYYLGGLNNQVKWRIKNGKLTVYGGSAGRVCKVELDNFPLEDGELGIFDTHKLGKLISITSGDLMIVTEKIKSVFTKLHLKDSNYDLTYSLADVLILGKNTYYNDPEKWIVEIELEDKDVDNLIKAKNALADVDNMLITTNKDLDGNYTCEFIFGDNTGFSNKITYQIMLGQNSVEGFEIPFDSNVLRDILASNKDMDRGTLKLSPEGILKLNFYSNDLNSEYFVARNE